MFEPNVRHRSAALAEPKPTPREVAEKLMVGIVLHDNRNTLAELNSFAHDVFTFLATGLKSAPQQGDVAATSDRIIARVEAGKPTRATA